MKGRSYKSHSSRPQFHLSFEELSRAEAKARFNTQVIRRKARPGQKEREGGGRVCVWVCMYVWVHKWKEGSRQYDLSLLSLSFYCPELKVP